MVFKLFLYNENNSRILSETHEKESFAKLSGMNWDKLRKGNYHTIEKTSGIDNLLKF